MAKIQVGEEFAAALGRFKARASEKKILTDVPVSRFGITGRA